MRLQTLTLVIFVAALAAVAPAENLRKAAQANDRAFLKAMKAKNMKWFESVGAPDFYDMDKAGHKSSMKESLAMMKQMFAVGSVKSASSKVVKVTKKGNGYLAITDMHMVLMMTQPGQPKASKMVDDSRQEEYWTKEHGKWKIHYVKSITDKMTVDGKPMPGGM